MPGAWLFLFDSDSRISISQYNDIQQKLNRFHTVSWPHRWQRMGSSDILHSPPQLASSHPERKEIARDVNEDCDSITEQLEMLSEAVETSSENPARFNLTMDEIGSRRKWISTQKQKVVGIKDSIKTITAGPKLPPVSEKALAENQAFLGSAIQRQEQIIKEQDTQLDGLARGIDTIQQMGDQITVHIKEVGPMRPRPVTVFPHIKEY